MDSEIQPPEKNTIRLFESVSPASRANLAVLKTFQESSTRYQSISPSSLSRAIVRSKAVAVLSTSSRVWAEEVRVVVVTSTP